MKVAGKHTFEAPQGAVWEALQDPTVLTSVLPGCEQLREVGEKSWEGELNIKVGPVQGRFKGRVEMHDLQEPESFTLKLAGQGSSGFVRATASVDLEGVGEKTVMSYDSDAHVGGRIASVGQRLLDSSAKAIIQQSLDGLQELIETARQKEAIGETGTGKVSEAAAEFQAPTQAEFAAKVAKEVAKEVIPRPVLIGGLLVIVLVILSLLLF